MKRYATAMWSGSGKEGTGHLTTQTGTLTKTPYDTASRFENGTKTNPEELLAAAHGGCFSMKLAFVLGSKGVTPDLIETKCVITIEEGTITSSHLEVKVKAIVDQVIFLECIADAKANCPVSKLFNTNITAEANLV